MKKLAIYLKQKRINAGLSQTEVAKKFGYTSPQFVSNWERGLSNPPAGILRQLAAIYKISADELFEILLSETIQEIKKDMTKKFYSKKKSTTDGGTF